MGENMKSFLYRLGNFGSAITLVAVQIIAITPFSTVHADTQSDWLNTAYNPSVIAGSDFAAGSYTIGVSGNTECEDLTFKTISTPYQTSCMTRMISGMMGDGKYIPNGVVLAGNTPSGWAGIPNSNTAFSISFYNNMFFNNNVYKNFQPTIGSGGQTYGFATGSVNTTLKDKTNHTLYVDANALSTSLNGQWMVIIANQSMVRINLATMEILPFAPWMSGTMSTAISDDGNFAAVQQQSSGIFKIYDLTTCDPAPDTITTPVNCQFRNINSEVSGQIPGYQNVSNIRFQSNSMITMKGYGRVNGVDFIRNYQLFAHGATGSGLQYLGLGDSFSAGEGVGKVNNVSSYMRGTDVMGYNGCHNSSASYPYIISAVKSYTSTSFKSVACSGAQSKHLVKLAQHPIMPPNNLSGEWLPGYKKQLDTVTALKPALMTITMGGNDIGFTGIIIKCLEPGTCNNSYEDRLKLVNNIDSKFDTWVNEYQKIIIGAVTPLSPSPRLYVVGYPQIIATTGSCVTGLTFDPTERGFSQQLTSYLNYVIKQAAAKAGAVYVDAEHSLDGNRLCETTPTNTAVTELSILKEGHIPNPESYHPNVLGQKMLASTILAATSNLTTSATPNRAISKPNISDRGTIPSMDALLSIPGHDTGPLAGLNAQSIGNANMSLIDNMLIKGQNFTYHLDGIDYALKPNTAYHLYINSTPTDLGTFTTNADGNLDISTTIPTSIDTGVHMLDITGPNLGEEGVDLYTTAYVQASATDFNGDGIPNTSDPCEYFPSSGIDVDQDGIDDACDSHVGIAPLYKARNGETAKGEDTSLIYIDRNTTVATSIGISDYNPLSADWVTIAQTAHNDGSDSKIASFVTNDTGLDASTIYDRYVPVLSTRTSGNGCTAMKVPDLSPVTQATGLHDIAVDATNTNTCRTQAVDADVDNNGVADNQQPLYRARLGDAIAGENPEKIYVERNTNAAEAILNISDYDSNGDGWALIGTSESIAPGVYSNLAIVDSTASQVISNNGAISLTTQNSLDAVGLQLLAPEVIISNSGNCSALIPTNLGVVKIDEVRTTQQFALLPDQTCN